MYSYSWSTVYEYIPAMSIFFDSIRITVGNATLERFSYDWIDVLKIFASDRIIYAAQNTARVCLVAQVNHVKSVSQLLHINYLLEMA